MLPFNEHMPDFDDEFESHASQMKRTLVPLMFEELMAKEAGDYTIDTAGADYFFTQFFVTEDMRWDFNLIEKDFMTHCHDKLRDFAQVQMYDHTDVRYTYPTESHRIMVMGLILNGAKSGDEYCKGLIRSLFKTYYKPMYKQYKRFTSISMGELESLIKDNEHGELPMLGILLTMCSIDNIKMQEDVSLYYRLLNRCRKEHFEEDDKEICFKEFDADLYKECREQVEKWMEEDEKVNLDFRKQNRDYWKEVKITETALEYDGYPGDYVMRCLERSRGLASLYTHTLVVLKDAFPKEDFSFAEVQRKAVLVESLEALTDVSDNFDMMSQEILGIIPDDDLEEESWFKPDSVVVSSASKANVESKTLTNIAPVETAGLDKDDYLREIDELRRELKQKEQECKHLKSQYANANLAKREAEQLLSKYENDRCELIALREFAYKLEQEVPEVQQVSLDEMKAAIATCNFVIIGGHVNWVSKLKGEFPKWTYITPSTYRTVDSDIMANKDMVFFFTDYISHNMYYKFIVKARDEKIPFAYLHGVNMEQIIKQMYDSVRK